MPEMLQQCPMQQDGVLLTVLRMKGTNVPTGQLRPVLMSVVIAFSLLLFTILQLYCMTKTST
jgi:hypothetical protein